MFALRLAASALETHADWRLRLGARLARTFGTPIEWDETTRAGATDGAQVVDHGDGSYRLRLPLEAPDGQRVWASAVFRKPQGVDGLVIDDDPTTAALAQLAGEVTTSGPRAMPCCDPELLVRLAGTVTEQLQPAKNRREERQLAAYVGQLGATMEALTLLQRLVADLELSEELTPLAQKALPNLRNQIKAAALAFVQSAATTSNGDDHTDGARIAAWDGLETLRGPALAPMIEHWNVNVPVVRNRIEAPPIEGIRSAVVVPVLKNRQLYGWIVGLNRTGEGEFGSEEAGLLASTAAIWATHAHNVELFRERQSLLIGVVRALVAAIDAKDPYTCGHSERVALVARRLGCELGLDDSQCEWLYLAGLLHDVGKIGVADELLQKPGKLTTEEFTQVQRHVEMGYAILKDLRQLREVLPGVRHHHESYDGSGYPDRLRGEEIPKVARILAVADAYDAMRSDRPYRKGMVEEQTQSILRRGAGQQWDAVVVDALIRISEEIQRLTTSRPAGGPTTPS